jgi:hypothetical protein
MEAAAVALWGLGLAPLPPLVGPNGLPGPLGFSYRVFHGVFSLILGPLEDQIDYKTTRRRKLIKGECYKEIRISDQFM